MLSNFSKNLRSVIIKGAGFNLVLSFSSKRSNLVFALDLILFLGYLRQVKSRINRFLNSYHDVYHQVEILMSKIDIFDI